MPSTITSPASDTKRRGGGAMLVGMFERYTDRACRVLVLAQEEARRLNHGFLGTEHILLGLIHEGEGVAAMTLSSLGIDLDKARAEVTKLLTPQAPQAGSGSPPFTPRTKKVLELSLREALQLGHRYIGTEHLLLGLLREGEGVAVQVMTALGADLAVVRHRVLEQLASQPEESHGHKPASLEATGVGPRCPTCRGVLEGNVAYKILPVSAADITASQETIDVLFVYCKRCLVMLAHTDAGGLEGNS